MWLLLQHSLFRRHHSRVSMMVCLTGTSFSANPFPQGISRGEPCKEFPYSHPGGDFTVECWWAWLLPLNSILGCSLPSSGAQHLCEKGFPQHFRGKISGKLHILGEPQLCPLQKGLSLCLGRCGLLLGCFISAFG